MSIEIKVPTVGESISSGILGAWKKNTGEYVKEGDVLLEFETDKVTSEVYAEASGVLEQLVSEGTEVQVGQVVAKIDETAKAPAGAPAAKEAAPAAKAVAAPASASAASETDVENLSPAVRRLIEEQNVDPSQVSGSGKGGRILKEDVMAFVQKRSATSVVTPPTQITPRVAPAAPNVKSSTRKKMTPLRRKIADRLVSAQHQAALLTTFNEIDMTNVMTLRKQFQDRFTKKHDIKLGFMSFFVKAVLYALKEVPAINARIDGEEIVQNNFYDIGVAISTPKGLMVPVLRDCDQLSLAGIEQAIADYAVKSREGKISLPDLEGGVFSITNGGVFGSLLSTPIVNPPQSGILGMHSIQERPMAINGQVVIRPMMYVALTYDHRLVDGREAVTFLVRIKEFVENPAVHILDL